MQDFYEPKVGDVAPNFQLPSTRGKDMTLEELHGKDVILYFYPKDDTPGCTAEACAFRDREGDLTKSGAVVLGVSTDPLPSHQKFRDKYKLNFPLLSDQTAAGRADQESLQEGRRAEARRRNPRRHAVRAREKIKCRTAIEKINLKFIDGNLNLETD